MIIKRPPDEASPSECQGLHDGLVVDIPDKMEGLQFCIARKLGRTKLMTSVHRLPARRMPVAVAGDGMFMFDKDGKRYIDGYAGGACVSCLGHSQESVVEAVRD
ncbi:MAG: aminotransferase class III-fold pyridoxal phosphate-dependent enzyme [Mesorhizobium sp.]|nr:MAG: aminotransferase class III-fold pyridoxal phosphate-dependent enzyme [Mesorhizobium sp.]